MYSQAVTWALVVDTSPPIAGHVYDGRRVDGQQGRRDADFQTDISYLASYWEGFYDPHSTIKEYYISLGSCKECENVIGNQAIGITQGMSDITHTELPLFKTTKYYTCTLSK